MQVCVCLFQTDSVRIQCSMIVCYLCQNVLWTVNGLNCRMIDWKWLIVAKLWVVWWQGRRRTCIKDTGLSQLVLLMKEVLELKMIYYSRKLVSVLKLYWMDGCQVRSAICPGWMKAGWNRFTSCLGISGASTWFLIPLRSPFMSLSYVVSTVFLPIHLLFVHDALQPVPLPEVRLWLPIKWLNSHIHVYNSHQYGDPTLVSGECQRSTQLLARDSTSLKCWEDLREALQTEITGGSCSGQLHLSRLGAQQSIPAVCQQPSDPETRFVNNPSSSADQWHDE